MPDSHLIATLRYAAFSAVADYDAYLFIATVNDGKHIFQSVDAVSAEIALVRDLPPVITNGNYPSSSHVYRRAYSDKLRQLQHDLHNPTAELYRKRYDANGYRQAIEMAFRNQGNSDALLRAMENADHTWMLQTKVEPESAVQRRYAQGYRQGLQDAITLVESDDKPFVAYIPDWFEADALPQLNQLLSVRHQYDTAQIAFMILQQSEGDLWRIERNIKQHHQWLEQVQQSGDATMETYVRDVLMWIEKGQDIIANCTPLS